MLPSFFFASTATAHSWIHCADYTGDVENYETGMCNGHPRPQNGNVPDAFTFGQDMGFDSQAGVCHSTETNTAAAPAATYQRGQTVTLAWPSKNHVAATCTNAFIPDTSTQLFVAAQAATPTFTTQVPASFSDDPHVQGVIDFKGFQNCPDFCSNTDKSLCTGTFVVPDDMADGTYTFQWNWVFNQGSPAYVSCFDATISGDDAGATPAPDPVTAPTVTPRPTTADEADCHAEGEQCDGMLFDGDSCCQSGLTCYDQSVYFSQCLPDGWCPDGWDCQNEVCVDHLDQCGGEFHTGSACCTDETDTCVEQSVYYSQCRTDCPDTWSCAGIVTKLETGGSSFSGAWLGFFLILSILTFFLGGKFVRWFDAKNTGNFGQKGMGGGGMEMQKANNRVSMPPVPRTKSSDPNWTGSTSNPPPPLKPPATKPADHREHGSIV